MRGEIDSNNKMTYNLFRRIVIFLIILFLSPIITAEVSRTYIPNEIIVKFRENAADTIEKQTDSPIAILNSSPKLAQFHTKHRVRQISPLVKNFRSRHQQLQSILQKNESLLTQKEKHIRRRLQRAPAEVKVPNLERIYKIRLDCPDEQSLQEALEAYRSNPDVEYAELNRTASIESVPNDPTYNDQWALNIIDAPEAWNIYTGSQKIVVAVLDTGVDYRHRDITNNMWINAEEYEGVEGVDDDNNGYIDDIYGYNFIYNTSDPLDDHGHGTHCAGIIGAGGNNNLDISGVCWNTRIMALKSFNYNAEGQIYDLVEAIVYAVTNGADIISNSWSIRPSPYVDESEIQPLKEAYDYAYSQGVIAVAAAANYDTDEPIYYPACYQNVIAVAATDSQDNRASYSNYGDWVDIAAPGHDILSLRAANLIPEGATIYNQYLMKMNGTSMACPHVAGACALLLSANPTMTYRDVYNKITETADPIAPGICRSNGRLNLSKAMQAVVPSKGYVNFDQDYYTYTSRVGLLVADRDLKGRGSQTVTVIAEGGDTENIVLTETSAAFGVFTGNIRINSGQVVTNDGILQTASGEVITAIYTDPDGGSGNHTSTDIAFIDYEVPILLDIDIEVEARQVTIELTTDEQTLATIHYGLVSDEQFAFSKEDFTVSTNHTFKLQSLSPETDYYFVIDLADVAGNKVTLGYDNQDYSFMTSSDTIGLRVPDAYRTIQDAIDNASDGETIWIADGTYTGTGNKNIDFKGKAITVKSENGPLTCIINCKNEGFGFYFHSGEGPDSVLHGLTIWNGTNSGRGGGIYCDQSSPTITNCIFSNNTAGKYGGGMYNFNNSCPKLTNCKFIRNSAGVAGSESGNGGGMCNLLNSNPTLINCEFFQNHANYQGGGIYNEDKSNPIIIKCYFYENSAKNGGGMYNFSNSNPLLSNCILVDNSADYGGAIQNASSTNIQPSIITLTNCVSFNNSAEKICGGILNSSGGASLVNNSILWHNSDQNGANESAQIFNTTVNQNTAVNYSCVQGWTGNIRGIGNINNDPLFFDEDKDDYHLKSTGWRWDNERQRWHYDEVTSPCIDAGNPGSPLNEELLAIPDDPTNKWGINTRINMGVYGGTREASLAPHGWNLPGDLTNDGNVNMKDYAAQIQSWPAIDSQPGDLDRDGKVDTTDLTLLAKDWLKYIKPPYVNIVYPTPGMVIYGLSSNIEVQADAWDDNGSIVKVEFSANGLIIGRDDDGSDGWNINWSQHSVGEYKLIAKATDNGGITTTSDEVTIWIVPSP